MAWFKLLHGKHVQNSPTRKDSNNNPIEEQFNQGDVFESDVDLLKMNSNDGPQGAKFYKLTKAEAEKAKARAARKAAREEAAREEANARLRENDDDEEQDEDDPQEERRDELERMTVEQLKETAEEMELDIPAHSKKADIVQLILDNEK